MRYLHVPAMKQKFRLNSRFNSFALKERMQQRATAIQIIIYLEYVSLASKWDVDKIKEITDPTIEMFLTES